MHGGGIKERLDEAFERWGLACTVRHGGTETAARAFIQPLTRETGDEQVVVAINTSGADASCAIPDDYAVRLADGHAMLTVSDAAAHYDNGLLHVPAGSATILG